MLDSLGFKAFKVASCDITNFPLLKKNCKKTETNFLSTGASNINEIQKAMKFIFKFNKKFV